MTTLSTGLPISSRAADTKITPALRLAIQKGTAVFQKDFCYDFLQAVVDEPDIADTFGLRVFLNYCLRKPDTLVESFLDAIDQNVAIGGPAALADCADTVLDELDNFLEFVHGLIELIDSGDIFKPAYHETDAWKLAHKLLDPIQRRLFGLAVQDRQQLTDQPPGAPPIELSFAADAPSSGFYQAFVTIDKFLKHSFESRVLLEPAKLVEEANELVERRTELRTFRTMFPPTQTSTTITKKFGRFGREEAVIEQFLESDKFKELSKLKAQMSGGQLTRQPSTRAKRTKQPVAPKHDAPPSPDVRAKSKRSITPADSRRDGKDDSPFLQDEPSPTGKQAFADSRHRSSSESDGGADGGGRRRQKSTQTGKPVSRTDSTTSARKPARNSMPASVSSATTTTATAGPKRKRARPPAHEEPTSAAKRKRSKRRKSGKKTGSGDEEEGDVFEIDKIIGESVDINSQVIYRVLWKGFPESEATWEFANGLADCAAVDVWHQTKNKDGASSGANGMLKTGSGEGREGQGSTVGQEDKENGGGEHLISTGSPAALALQDDD